MHTPFSSAASVFCALVTGRSSPRQATQRQRSTPICSCVTQDARAAVALIEADRFLPEKDGICVKSVLRLYRLFSVEKGARDSI